MFVGITRPVVSLNLSWELQCIINFSELVIRHSTYTLTWSAAASSQTVF